MKNIIIQYDKYAQLPDQENYSIDSKFDEKWYRAASQIKKDLAIYLDKNEKELLEVVEFSEYHHGLNRHHLYVYNSDILNKDFLDFLYKQANHAHCFFELECYSSSYLGMISFSVKYIIYDSEAQDSHLMEFLGLC